ncbi:MAG: TIGR01777 family oxidoreductase [Verrucomicrobiota bacterium]
MKIGLTGATGFVGRAVIDEALRRRWKVVGYSRSGGIERKGLEWRSIADPTKVDLSGLDGLIHLAGEPIVGWWSKGKKAAIRNSRIDGTTALVEAIGSMSRAQRPAALVSASAIGYYGNRSDDWLDEEADVGFGFLSDVCRKWEAAAAPATRLGVRVVNPRIGLVFGDGGFLERLRLPFKLGLGGRLGSGEQWMSWIHRVDLARLLLQSVADDSIHGAVNAVSPEPVRNVDFTRTYARLLRRPAIFPVPGGVLKLLPGGMSEIFLDSQRVEPVVMEAFGFEWRFPTLEEGLTASIRDRELS